MRDRALPGLALAALLSPTAALVFFRAWPRLDPLMMSPELHFWLVSGTALAAAATCALLILSAPTLRETRLLFLALAFLSIAGVFSVHGLMTPGHIAHNFYVSLPAAAWFSALAGAVLAAVSTVQLPPALERIIRRAGLAVFAWAAIAVAAFIALSLTNFDWLDGVPTDSRFFQHVLAFVATALYAMAAVRYIDAWRLARLPVQAAMATAMVLLTQVPPIILWGQLWHASWWIYHWLYAASFAVLLGGWAFEARRAGTIKVIAEALSMRDAMAALNRGVDAHVLELVDAIEAKDRATLGHVRRVSSYAVDIGRALGLGDDELRRLALAAEMHDVGKIGVPDAILAKPGPLTEEEFATMRLHTGRGDQIARQVAALRDLAPVIRAHHERCDGSGYPDGLRGDAIPILARIIAVADSYDAMTSARPYRAPLSHERAVAELTRVRGRELDAACVDAFLASIQRRRAA